jgi:hypothetical protein
VDAGMLLIHPTLVEAQLQWRYEDSNNIFQLETLTQKKVDMSADAYLDGAKLDGHNPVEFYLGIDATNWTIKLVSDQTLLNNGVYTEYAFLLELDSYTYYADPISRSFLVVPGTVNVDLVDEQGNSNNDRLFTYDGKAHGMDAVVTENGTPVDTTKGKLTIMYMGVQNNGTTYASTNRPVHGGVYQVVASYVEYDAEGNLAKFGMDAGVMVIKKAKAEIAVDSVIVPTGTVVKLSDLISISGAVNGDAINTTIISGQIATDGSFSENGLAAMQGVVNIDFPAWLDRYLKKIPVLNDGYETSLSGKTFTEKAAVINDALTAMGIDSVVMEGIVKLLDQIPEGVDALTGERLTEGDGVPEPEGNEKKKGDKDEGHREGTV